MGDEYSDGNVEFDLKVIWNSWSRFDVVSYFSAFKEIDCGEEQTRLRLSVMYM